ncbi:MAG: response regulator [Hyphomicrobium sp.]|jgi:CheY-like chemotaxis protein
MFEALLSSETAESAAVSNQKRFKTRPKSQGMKVMRTARKILVVEDELWSALDMEWVIRKLGHDVVGPVATAKEALELADELRPDLVLMDIRLANDDDGIDTAIAARQRFNIPSIFVSAHGDLPTRNRAASANPSGFIEKPFTPETLANAIAQALDPDD